MLRRHVDLDPVLAGVARAGDDAVDVTPRDPGDLERGTSASAGDTVASSARASGPCTARTARVDVMSAMLHPPPCAAFAPSSVLTIGSVFDAFGMTSSSSSSTHHTMMSSTTWASSGSSRCVYCARPGPMRPRSLVSAHWSTGTAPGPGDPHRAEVRHVEDDRVLPARAVLLEHAAVLDRHVPATELGQAGAEGAVLGIERAVAQRVVHRRRRLRAVTRTRPRRAEPATGPPARRRGAAAGSLPNCSLSCDGGSRPYFTSRWR